jgi:hypothetical protein
MNVIRIVGLAINYYIFIQAKKSVIDRPLFWTNTKMEIGIWIGTLLILI